MKLPQPTTMNLEQATAAVDNTFGQMHYSGPCETCNDGTMGNIIRDEPLPEPTDLQTHRRLYFCKPCYQKRRQELIDKMMTVQ